MIKTKYIAALDMSGPFSSWSLMEKDSRKTILKESVKVSRKTNAVFFDSLCFRLNELAIEIHNIDQWYVGIGPGSYTGIRVAAAFVSGLLFASGELTAYSVPAYYPIAAEIIPEKKEVIGVLYQMTRSTFIVYRVSFNGKYLEEFGEPLILNENNINKEAEKIDRVVTCQDISSAEQDLNIFKDTLIQLNYFPVEKMFDEMCQKDKERPIGQLIYTRPPATSFIASGK